MSKTWIISDTHFNHEQMIRACGRPKDFGYKIFKALSKIPENDVLIHLGDVCIGKDELMHAKNIQPLKCKKILVRGNHDRKSNSWYIEHGWDFVCDYFVDIYCGKRVMFSHRPMLDHGCDHNIHGHLHNTVTDEDLYRNKLPGCILIAVEHTNYQPVKLNDKLLK